MGDEITGYTLRDVCELLKEQKADTRILNGASLLLDAALLLSPVYAGPDAAPILIGLLEAKNALVGLGEAAIKWFAKPAPEDYSQQAARLARAHCLLTYTAYFDALLRTVPDLMTQVKLSEKDKGRVRKARSREVELRDPIREVFGSKGKHAVPDLVISVPHPASPDGGSKARMALYEVMGGQLLKILPHDAFWGSLGDEERDYIRIAVKEDVPALASRIYRESLVGLADDYPQFLTWLLLSDQEMKTALLGRIIAHLQRIGADAAVQSADVMAAFELVGRTVDLGLKDLAEQIDGLRQMLGALSAPSASEPSIASGYNLAADLHTRYATGINKPVIEDRSKSSSGPKLVYPTVVDSYVPQAYRLVRYSSATTHLEQDDAWQNSPIADDLGTFLLRYLESAYSTRAPLLILGHPGSGKSLLTQVLAARLAYPAYSTVRVKLRDVSTTLSIPGQIVEQIYIDTEGERVTWPQFARSLPTPPVIILDGYDELLQATGSTQADYLDQVRRFQEDEADLGRPVRVIVTSRITLIDKVSIPAGTTIARLEEFDEPRRQAWTTVWNDRNRGYFAQAGVHEFQLPDNPRLTELAGQPLLLLMLAIYDSAGNQLRNSPDLDQTRLYYDLIVRFIRRELEKDTDSFSKLPPDEQQTWVARELERLGVAAIGMFNRQAVAIRREELNRDLAFFKAERTVPPAAGPRPLSQAELLIGSFLFIHESRSRSEEDADASAGPATYEFLHKTFGEFLTADYLLTQVLSEAKTVAKFMRDPDFGSQLRRELDQLNPNWFGCLVHTPLHTQPNALLMLREWVRHRPTEGMPARPELLAALDRIVAAQLRGLLTATTLPTLAPQERDTPYAPLPVLGHLATYTLNLILLRAYLCDDSYVLDEADLGDHPAGPRPWDRLAAIWRSWFAGTLAVLAARMTATRTGARITIVPSPSPLATTETTALATAYNASLALADDLTTASLGLHMASLISVPDTFIDNLRERVAAEAPDLIPVIDLAVARTTRHPQELPIRSAERGRNLGRRIINDSAVGYLPPGLAVESAEMAERLYRSSVSRSTLHVAPSLPVDFASLSRYAAEVVISSRVAAEPRWLPDLVSRLGAEEWGVLLSSPAAAPILRASRRQFAGALDPSLISRRIEGALVGEVCNLFDVDTATGVAILGWRGGNAMLSSFALGRIIQVVVQKSWRLLDIPTELWGDLADLFVSGEPEVAQHRQAFAELLTLEMRRSEWPLGPDSIEVSIDALRIDPSGGGEAIGDTAGELARQWDIQSDYFRYLFLLLVRGAREKSDRVAVRDLFSREGKGVGAELLWQQALGVPTEQSLGGVDIEGICLSLSYREAMDLRWALDIARQELPDQGAEPRRSTRPRRPR